VSHIVSTWIFSMPYWLRMLAHCDGLNSVAPTVKEAQNAPLVTPEPVRVRPYGESVAE
jgi:hypothetical protein